jgi:two-component system, OmpR family, response regulator ChvI
MITTVSESDSARLDGSIARATTAGVGQTEGPIGVLLVENDQCHRDPLVDKVSRCGLVFRSFADRASLLGALGAGIDANLIIVLDQGLSKMSGVDLLTLLRRHGVDLPVIFLNSRPPTAGETLTFDKKAIDGPPDELMVRGRLVLKLDVRRAEWDGVDVGLTHGEYNIVHLLASTAGRFVTYRAIYDRLRYEGFIAGPGGDGYHANVRSAIKRIRKKFLDLDATFTEIENYTKFGYRWGKPKDAA